MVRTVNGGNNRVYNGGSGQQLQWGGIGVYASGTSIGIYGAGGSAAHNNVQPSIAGVKMIRVQ
jgi:hypothetical protein